MTTEEFSIEFDLLYNNALSNSAPELNDFEKSLFLTKAQEELIRDVYEPTSKPKVETEKVKRRLEKLLKPAISTYNSALNSTLSTYKITSNSRFFEINSDVWYILYEEARTVSGNLYVVPVTEDQYFKMNANPFKKPNDKKVLRLEVSGLIADKRVVEIVSTKTITSYYYRYVSAPTPIIISDLTGDFDGLTIDGLAVQTECILNNELHRLILNRAVELATIAYKENTLTNNVQLNNRNV